MLIPFTDYFKLLRYVPRCRRLLSIGGWGEVVGCEPWPRMEVRVTGPNQIRAWVQAPVRDIFGGQSILEPPPNVLEGPGPEATGIYLEKKMYKAVTTG